MLYQSLKSIHYRTLLIFQNKKNPTNLRVKTLGGYINPIPPGFTPLALFRGKSPPQHNRTVKY